MNKIATTEGTLTHYRNCWFQYLGILDGPVLEFAPDGCVSLETLEKDNPYFRVSRAFQALRENNDTAFAKCFTNPEEQDLPAAKRLLDSVTCIKKYLATPNDENRLFIVDLWNSGRSGHELRLRLFLVKYRNTYKIHRVVKVLPSDVTVDESGMSEWDEQTFQTVDEETMDLDSYDDVPPASAFNIFIAMLRLSRVSNVAEFSQFIAHSHRQYALVGLFLMQSLKRVVAVEETKKHCDGIDDNGMLRFTKHELDITALNWDGVLINWHVELSRDKNRWVIASFANETHEPNNSLY